jgi:hypothetical protein
MASGCCTHAACADSAALCTRMCGWISAEEGFFECPWEDRCGACMVYECDVVVKNTNAVTPAMFYVRLCVMRA